MRNIRYCQVLGCKEQSKQTYRFPSMKDERLPIWLSATGNADLLKIPPEQILKKAICRRHFENKYMMVRCLTPTAVPTLHLPASIDGSQYTSLWKNRKNEVVAEKIHNRIYHCTEHTASYSPNEQCFGDTMANQVTTNFKTGKWTNEQIELLIAAYKKETCLYAVYQKNYRSMHLREKALVRVCEAVKKLRPMTTIKECSAKFHDLRNQFNIECSKVRATYKSGTCTDIYQPTLWYYPKLLFLETYMIPRKNVLEITDESSTSQQDSTSSIMEDESQESNENSNCENLIFPEENNESQVEMQQSSTIPSCYQQELDPLGNSTHTETYDQGSFGMVHGAAASNCNLQQVRPTFILPSPISPVLSTSSTTSGISSVSQSRQKKRKPQDLCIDDYSGAIVKLAESIQQPISINTTQNTSIFATKSILNPVDTFVNFVASVLQSFQDEELKVEVMSSLSQMLMNAKSIDIQRAKK